MNIMYSAHRVLLVEDNKMLQQVHSFLLKKLGCDVDIAASGEEALRYNPYDYQLIFLDIGLPGIDGIDVCRRIRDIDHEHHIPILVLTTHDHEFEPACREAGADAFLTKPISHDQFQKIANYLDTKLCYRNNELTEGVFIQSSHCIAWQN